MLHSLLIFSQIRKRLVKICIVPGINVVYLRIYQTLILISYHKQKERKNVLGREWYSVYSLS